MASDGGILERPKKVIMVQINKEFKRGCVKMMVLKK